MVILESIYVGIGFLFIYFIIIVYNILIYLDCTLQNYARIQMYRTYALGIMYIVIGVIRNENNMQLQ